MSDWVLIFYVTLGAGLAMSAGALLAAVEHISNRWLESELRHTVIAFGGGILLAAIALVLVEEGMLYLDFIAVTVCFGLGGITFMILDRVLNKKKKKAAQFIAMLLDFIPEVIALGGIFLLHREYAILLAILIALQNLPEGFNAYLELRARAKHKGGFIIFIFFIMAFLGPVAGLSSYFFLSEYPSVVSAIMLFAAGGILYLVFQDIAPQAKIKRHWAPALGSVMGFLFGIIGKMVVFHVT